MVAHTTACNDYLTSLTLPITQLPMGRLVRKHGGILTFVFTKKGRDQERRTREETREERREEERGDRQSETREETHEAPQEETQKEEAQDNREEEANGGEGNNNEEQEEQQQEPHHHQEEDNEEHTPPQHMKKHNMIPSPTWTHFTPVIIVVYHCVPKQHRKISTKIHSLLLIISPSTNVTAQQAHHLMSVREYPGRAGRCGQNSMERSATRRS